MGRSTKSRNTTRSGDAGDGEENSNDQMIERMEIQADKIWLLPKSVSCSVIEVGIGKLLSAHGG